MVVISQLWVVTIDNKFLLILIIMEIDTITGDSLEGYEILLIY